MLYLVQDKLKNYNDFPIENNYYFTMINYYLHTYKTTLNKMDYWTIYLLVGALMIFSFSMLFCYFQICLFMIWSKSDHNEMSIPPSEIDANLQFIDSVAVMNNPQNSFKVNIEKD